MMQYVLHFFGDVHSAHKITIRCSGPGGRTGVCLLSSFLFFVFGLGLRMCEVLDGALVYIFHAGFILVFGILRLV
jgi:hypothetical protein